MWKIMDKAESEKMPQYHFLHRVCYFLFSTLIRHLRVYFSGCTIMDILPQATREVVFKSSIIFIACFLVSFNQLYGPFSVSSRIKLSLFYTFFIHLWVFTAGVSNSFKFKGHIQPIDLMWAGPVKPLHNLWIINNE